MDPTKNSCIPQLPLQLEFAVERDSGQRHITMSLFYFQESILRGETQWHMLSAFSPEFLNISTTDSLGQIILAVGAVL